MLNKFLKDIVTIIVGKYAEPIIDLLNRKKYVNEFIIAKKLDITINQTRNILYKLSDYGLVSSIRKKDKKKGWYTYFWKIEIIKALEFLKSVRLKQITNVNNQIKNRETKQFYMCKRCNIEVNEESALLQDFTCNECGDIFTLRDNFKILRELKKGSDKLGNEIKLIDEELEKENSKIEKEKLKEIQKEEKEKALKRKEKKKATSKLKKSLAQKKPTKNKIKKIKRILKTVRKAVKKKKKVIRKKKKKVVKRKVKKKLVKKKIKKKEIKKRKKASKSTRPLARKRKRK